MRSAHRGHGRGDGHRRRARGPPATQADRAGASRAGRGRGRARTRRPGRPPPPRRSAARRRVSARSVERTNSTPSERAPATRATVRRVAAVRTSTARRMRARSARSTWSWRTDSASRWRNQAGTPSRARPAIVAGTDVDAATALTATMPIVALARIARPTRRPGSRQRSGPAPRRAGPLPASAYTTARTASGRSSASRPATARASTRASAATTTATAPCAASAHGAVGGVTATTSRKATSPTTLTSAGSPDSGPRSRSGAGPAACDALTGPAPALSRPRPRPRVGVGVGLGSGAGLDRHGRRHRGRRSRRTRRRTARTRSGRRRRIVPRARAVSTASSTGDDQVRPADGGRHRRRRHRVGSAHDELERRRPGGGQRRQPGGHPAADGERPPRPARRGRTSANAPQATSAGTIPSLTRLSPRAVTPPSASTSACSTTTTATHRMATAGPTSRAARPVPTRWALVPSPTGTHEQLGDEQVGGDHGRQAGGPVPQRGAGPAGGHGDAARGHDPGRRRGREVDPAVRDVHRGSRSSGRSPSRRAAAAGCRRRRPGRSPPPRCPAARRRGRRWPASSAAAPASIRRRAIVRWWARPVSTTSVEPGSASASHATGTAAGSSSPEAIVTGVPGGGTTPAASGAAVADETPGVVVTRTPRATSAAASSAGPRADEQVAALQAHDPVRPARAWASSMSTTLRERPGVAVGRAADVAPLGGGRGEGDDRVGRVAVGHDDVGLGEEPGGPTGEQQRVAGARRRPGARPRRSRPGLLGEPPQGVEGGGGHRAAAPLPHVRDGGQAARPQRGLGLGRPDEADRQADDERRREASRGRRGRSPRPAPSGRCRRPRPRPRASGRPPSRMAAADTVRSGSAARSRSARARPSASRDTVPARLRGDRHHLDVRHHRGAGSQGGDAGRAGRLVDHQGVGVARRRRRRGSPGPRRPGTTAASGRGRPARRGCGSSRPRSGGRAGSRRHLLARVVAAGHEPLARRRRCRRCPTSTIDRMPATVGSRSASVVRHDGLRPARWRR